MAENDWIIGVIFSFASSILSCLGLIFQKYAHNQNQALPDDKKYPIVAGIVCSPYWWASFIMMGLFPFPFDFFAYAFAAQSLVAPFAGLTLIMNQFFAPLILKEKLHRVDIYASLVVFVGTTLTTVTGNHDDESYVIEDLLYYFTRISFLIGVICLLMIMILMYSSLKLTDPLNRNQKPCNCDSKKQASNGNGQNPSITTENGPGSPMNDNQKLEVNLDNNIQIDNTNNDTNDNSIINSNTNNNIIINNSRLRNDLPSFDLYTEAPSVTSKNKVKPNSRKAKYIAKASYANFSSRPFYYGFIAGGFGALQNIFFKSAGVLTKTSVIEGGESAWTTAYPYVFLITVAILAISQLSFLNKGMARYDAILILPLYNACYIFLSVSMGALYFGEFDNFDLLQSILFPVGVFITVLGILLFIFKPRENKSESGLKSKSSVIELKSKSPVIEGIHITNVTEEKEKQSPPLDENAQSINLV